MIRGTRSKPDPAPETLPTTEGQSMNALRLVTLALASAALLLIAAGVAHADEDDSEGYPSTQSPTQGADAGAATLDNSADSFNDAANGDDRPDGANGKQCGGEREDRGAGTRAPKDHRSSWKSGSRLRT